MRALVLLSLLSSSCSLIVDTDLKQGIGAPCTGNPDCQGGLCEGGLCTFVCATDAECPTPSVCAAGHCHVPLRVGAIWSGVASGQEGWTMSHKVALEETSAKLGYLRFTEKENFLFKENQRKADDIKKDVDEYFAAGADVVITNSSSMVPPILEKAKEYPQKKFVTVAGLHDNAENVGSLYARNEQAWYVAGKMAARASRKALGMIAPHPSPSMVRAINAFALGARRENKNAKIVIRWLGFWKDVASSPGFTFTPSDSDFVLTDKRNRYREEVLAGELFDVGCDVVVHRTDTQRSVTFTEEIHRANPMLRLFSIAADVKDGCYEGGTSANGAKWQESCLGSAYWNWAPGFEFEFEAMHHGTWKPRHEIEPLKADDTSLTGFVLNTLTTTTGIGAEDARLAILDAAKMGYADLFKGPYNATGQRDKDGDGMPDATQAVADGEFLSDAELESMCWFVDGWVEAADYTDYRKAGFTVDKMVPALVPVVTDAADPEVLKRYGDVIDFQQKLGFLDPKADLHCSKSD